MGLRKMYRSAEKIHRPLAKYVHAASKVAPKATEVLAGGALMMGQPEIAIPIAEGGAELSAGLKAADKVLNY